MLTVALFVVGWVLSNVAVCVLVTAIAGRRRERARLLEEQWARAYAGQYDFDEFKRRCRAAAQLPPEEGVHSLGTLRPKDR